MNKEINRYGGVLVLSDSHSGEVLMTDIYNESTKEQMWMQWIRVAIDKFLMEPKRFRHFILKDYPTGNTEVFHRRNDKQVAFLLHGNIPQRSLLIAEAAFVRQMTGELNIHLPLSYIGDYIASHKEEWGIFKARMEESEELFGYRFLRGNPCHCQRVFELKGYFSFCGKERLRNIEDVAWIFRTLQAEEVIQTFLILAKGTESVTLHISMGGNRHGLYDLNAILQTVEKFQTQKIWLAYRKPEGFTGVTEEEGRTWRKLYGIFGERLGRVITLSGMTGTYSLYSEQTVLSQFPEGEQEAEQVTVSGLLKQTADTRVELLILNTENSIVGKLELTADALKNMEQLADTIRSASILTGGNGVILCTNDDRMDAELATALHEALNRIYDHSIVLVDVVTLGVERQESVRYGSFSNMDADQNGNRFEKIDIIRTSGGSGMIRVKMGGEYLPAEKLRKSELENIDKGKLTKEEMADKYFGER